jgi:hypothetical protein
MSAKNRKILTFGGAPLPSKEHPGKIRPYDGNLAVQRNPATGKVWGEMTGSG